MMYFIKKLKEIITVCPCTLLLGSYMFLNLPNGILHFFELLIELFDLFSFLPILQTEATSCLPYPFPIFTHLQWSLLFEICSPKKVAYPCMSFLHLASEAFFQSPDCRADVVLLHIRLLIMHTRQDRGFNVWVGYILELFWVGGEDLGLCEDHILSVGVDQGEKLGEVYEFLL